MRMHQVHRSRWRKRLVLVSVAGGVSALGYSHWHEQFDTNSQASSMPLMLRSTRVIANGMQRRLPQGENYASRMVQQIQEMPWDEIYQRPRAKLTALAAEHITDTIYDQQEGTRWTELLRSLVYQGAIEILFQHFALNQPTDRLQLQRQVACLTWLLGVTSKWEPDDVTRSRSLHIPLASVGSALYHLDQQNTLGASDWLRLGDLLMRLQIRTEEEDSLAFTTSSRSSLPFELGAEGFTHLLSSSLPPSIQQFSLWALSYMLQGVLSSKHGHSRHVSPFFAPETTANVLNLSPSNMRLQLRAAELLDLILQAVAQNAASATSDMLDHYLDKIQIWMQSDRSDLQLAAAKCLRTMTEHPVCRKALFDSPETMQALFHCTRSLHERQQTLAKEILLSKDLDIQEQVSRVFRNLCLSTKDADYLMEAFRDDDGEEATAVWESKRTLPMSKALRGAQDVTDLPVIGADEYNASTQFGWVDILTSWTGSDRPCIRSDAIDSLYHLAAPPLSDVAQGDHVTLDNRQLHILQAWLMSMLQRVRNESEGGELLAVQQLEAIAQVSDDFTPGNERILFNPAVVDAGVDALATLAETHHDQLLREGAVPLLALLGISAPRSPEDGYDIRTQCARVLANLSASSCHQIEQISYKRREEDEKDIEVQLQQTVSGRRFWHLMQRWWDLDLDPIRRSNYFRAVQNTEAYVDGKKRGHVVKDVYHEGVHPILSPTMIARKQVEQDASDEEPSADLDVVFVHGLRGDPFGTWRTDMNEPLSSTNDVWPDTLLSPDLVDNHGIETRIVTLGYEANLVSWSSPWPALTLQERAGVMLNALSAANIGSRPVVFVAHSMGGLLVKKMLLLAAQSQDRNLTSLIHNTLGTVFLAVPHFGSDLGGYMGGSESVRSMLRAHPALEDLCAPRHDGRLEQLNDSFAALNISCINFGEEKASPLGFGISAMVVKPESADPGIGSFRTIPDSDHMTICKAKSEDSPLYQEVRNYILKCVDNARRQQ